MLAPLQGIEPPPPGPVEVSLSPPGSGTRALRAVLERLLAQGGAAWRAAARERFRQRSLFLPPRTVFLRSLARLAYETRLGADTTLAGLLRCVDASLRELLAEQAGAEAAGAPYGHDEAAFYEHVAARAGIPPETARRACVALNRLPFGERRAFQRAVLEGHETHVETER